MTSVTKLATRGLIRLRDKDDIIGDIVAAGVFVFATVILPGIGYLLSSMDPALKHWLILYCLVALWGLAYLLAHLYDRLSGLRRNRDRNV